MSFVILAEFMVAFSLIVVVNWSLGVMWEEIEEAGFMLKVMSAEDFPFVESLKS